MREIITELDVREPPSASPAQRLIKDEYKDRLLKYIPAEIIAGQISIDAILAKASNTDYEVLSWFAFLALLALTPFYLKRLLKVTKRVQIAISMVSFCVWVAAYGGPFATIEGYDRVYAAVCMIIFTLAIPVIEPQS